VTIVQDHVDVQKTLAQEICEFTHDPLGFADFSYPWGKRDLEKSNGPYKWQAEIFSTIGEHLQDPKTIHMPLRIAVASGHGIGKSAFLSMVCDWAMSTVEDCKVLITAGTGIQLKTKTQPELSKWFRLSINSKWFDVKSQSITVKNEKHANTWRTDLITWDEKNSEAFQGLHNKGKRILIIFDEAAAIADIIWEATQGALTDEGTEIIWLAFGNPTRNSGKFADCFSADKARWRTFQIDSRTVEGTNKEELRQEVEKYGEDSDYIRYRIRGEFPRRGTSQFIPHDVVAAARRYRAQGFEHLPKILTLDVARFGDNETVFGLRQGRKFDIPEAHRGLDTVQTTDRAAALIDSVQPDAVVIDGDGIGGAVVDGLRHRGYKAPMYNIFEFHGGAEPMDGNMYYNRRTECWGLMREHLTDGAQIPDDPQLERQLTGPNYDIVHGKIHHGSIFLESKDDMRKRGIESPDRGDCYAMSFAVKVAPKKKDKPPARPVTSWS
jgi:hypothetical protein